MSLPAFPQVESAARPRTPRGKRPFHRSSARRRPDPQSRPQPKAFSERDIRRFPQMHRPYLPLKRYLFPLRNE
jgi:hypothetical protein